MTDIKKLAEEKVALQNRLQAIGMTNVYGRSNDELVELEIDRINTTRRLREIQNAIDRYINKEEA